jgi:cobalt/nickel transport protein
MSSETAPGRTSTAGHRISTRALVGAGILLSVVLAAVLSIFASAAPDGLERVAETLGFDEAAEDSAVAGSPLADYGTAGVADEWLSTAVAGTVGLLLTGLVAFGLMRLLARPSTSDEG